MTHDIRRYRQTKIVATLGPASGAPDKMRALFEAGVDVFRMNFSHGSHEDHRKNLETARMLEVEFDRPVAILADMQGPKLRIGRFEDDKIEIIEGQSFRFDLNDALGDTTRVQLPHPEVIEVMDVGSEILLDDGKVRVEVTGKDKDGLDTKVMAGSYLSNNKGFNIPGVKLPIKALTDKDRIDLEAAIEMGADWIAQSFVQSAEDVIEAQNLINGRAALMAKIEKPSAVDDIDEIIEVVDAIMLARGDLGVEILMLSAETAVGDYPIEAVSIMNRICESTESDRNYRRIMDADHPETQSDASDAITVAATHVAEDIGAAAIVNYTTSGSTTLRAVRQRPVVPVLCLTQNIQTARRLVLSFGVRTMHITDVNSFAETVQRATGLVSEKGYAQKGDKIVLTAGVPFGVSGTTNVLRIAEVE